MSARTRNWLPQRGQADAALAIDQVLAPQVGPQEQVQLLDDDAIDDSPYQARRTIAPEQLAELVTAMRSAGFQGVLIARPHPDPARQRRGDVQLVYGHRRRAAWRQVCAERGEPCRIPTIVRSVSDTQMLLVGAQENLQRHDLDPVEEAQLVAWLERMFPQQSQAELGTLIGKSSDWVSTRARIHRLPEPLKASLERRPRAIAQILEIGTLATDDLHAAITLAERVVAEQLTLDTVRALVRGYTRPQPTDPTDRDARHNRRGAATFARNTVGCDAERDSAPKAPSARPSNDMLLSPEPCSASLHLADLLHQAVQYLTQIAAQADQLPHTSAVYADLAAAEAALERIRAHIPYES